MLSKRLTTTLLLATQALSTAIMPRQTEDPLSLHLLSFNIRYAASASIYERPWSTRGPLLIERVSTSAADAVSAGSVAIIGMQEVLHSQLVDIQNGLGPAWEYLGTGRDDGKEAGEYCPLWYRPAQLRLLASTQKWLSPTPDVPSFWPGAGSRRYVVAAVFEHDETGTRFIAANTHLDNVSSQARSEGAKIILGVIRTLQEEWGPGLPVTLSGDFNSEPGQDAYATVQADGYLADLYELADEAQRFGSYTTYSGFNPNEEDDVSARIDFLFLGPDAAMTWQVARYEVLDNVVNGIYISDHKAVVGDVKLVTS